MRYRRRRTAFTEEQLARLEESFSEEKFPGNHNKRTTCRGIEPQRG